MAYKLVFECVCVCSCLYIYVKLASHCMYSYNMYRNTCTCMCIIILDMTVWHMRISQAVMQEMMRQTLVRVRSHEKEAQQRQTDRKVDTTQYVGDVATSGGHSESHNGNQDHDSLLALMEEGKFTCARLQWEKHLCTLRLLLMQTSTVCLHRRVCIVCNVYTIQT